MQISAVFAVDDIALMVLDPETNLLEVIRETEAFVKIARLTINKTNSELLCLNVPSELQIRLQFKTGFKLCPHHIKYLEINITKSYSTEPTFCQW